MSRSPGLSALQRSTQRAAESCDLDDDYDPCDPDAGPPPPPRPNAVAPEPAVAASATSAREESRADAEDGRSVAPFVGTTPKRAEGDRVHTSIYLPRDVWRRLRAIAAAEDCKVHDLIIEGVTEVVGRRDSR